MSKLGTLTRRGLLIGSAAILGGTAFGFYEYKREIANPLEPDEGEITLNPYVIIANDGITIVTPRAEMGQGTHTTLAALVAEELDVDWQTIRSIHGPVHEAYANNKIGSLSLPFAEYNQSQMKNIADNSVAIMGKLLSLHITGSSTSVIDSFDKMRLAGASARSVLIKAAAKKLKLSEKSLTTQNGFIIAEDGRKLPYGELAEEAASINPPEKVTLKDPSQWKILGKSMPRLDMAKKVTGEAKFGIDVQLDGMHYATVRINPRLGGKMISFNASKAEKMSGVKKVVDMGNGIGVIATNTWYAMQAAEAVEIEWGVAPYPAETEDIFEEISKTFDDYANSWLRDDGDVDLALTSGDLVEAEYRAPYLAHTTMEPMNATALLKDGKLTIWAGSQAPISVAQSAASIADLSDDDVELHVLFLGGGFGRRPEHDFTDQAVKLALAMPDIPIKLTWTREEDVRHDFYRPGTIAKLSGKIDGKNIDAIRMNVAGASVMQNQVRRVMGIPLFGPDRILVEGAFDQPYSIPNYQVNGYISDVEIPVGSWRSVGYSHNAFFHECFLDELAHHGNLDPLQMRLDLMKDEDQVSYKVVKAVGEMAGWNERTKYPHKGFGLAFSHSFDSPTAQVIEIIQTENGIKINKVWCAIDVGTALDPSIIEAQVMSGIIYGLSAAVMQEITFSDGQVEQSNFHDYDALRMSISPEIEVKVLQNKDQISGVGECGTPPSMPALANAIFDLTGKRIRELPLNKHVEFVS